MKSTKNIGIILLLLVTILFSVSVLAFQVGDTVEITADDGTCFEIEITGLNPPTVIVSDCEEDNTAVCIDECNDVCIPGCDDLYSDCVDTCDGDEECESYCPIYRAECKDACPATCTQECDIPAVAEDCAVSGDEDTDTFVDCLDLDCVGKNNFGNELICPSDKWTGYEILLKQAGPNNGNTGNFNNGNAACESLGKECNHIEYYYTNNVWYKGNLNNKNKFCSTGKFVLGPEAWRAVCKDIVPENCAVFGDEDGNGLADCLDPECKNTANCIDDDDEEDAICVADCLPGCKSDCDGSIYTACKAECQAGYDGDDEDLDWCLTYCSQDRPVCKAACPVTCEEDCTAPVCSDPDVNNPLVEKNTVTSATGETKTDECLNEEKVKEYSCLSNGNIQYSFQTCLAGTTCNDGACAAPVCSDTDVTSEYPDGMNPTLKGTVNGDPTMTDICIVNTIDEWYCDENGNPNNMDLDCDQGSSCVDGACEESENLVCSADNLELCNDYEECEDFNGKWEDATNECVEKSTCSQVNPSFCQTQQSCVAVSGFWYINTCNVECPSGTSDDDNDNVCVLPLSITLTKSASTPLAGTVTQGDSGVSFTKVTLNASGQADITSIGISREQMANVESLSKVYLYEGSSPLGNCVLNNGLCEIDFSPPISLNVGQSKNLELRADVSNNAGPGDVVKLGLMTVSPDSGNYVFGNTMTIAKKVVPVSGDYTCPACAVYQSGTSDDYIGGFTDNCCESVPGCSWVGSPLSYNNPGECVSDETGLGLGPATGCADTQDDGLSPNSPNSLKNKARTLACASPCEFTEGGNSKAEGDTCLDPDGTVPADIILGDVNNDGVITLDDAIDTAKYFFSPGEYPTFNEKLANVDCVSNEITLDDAILIAKKFFDGTINLQECS
jgi:hypothetical protein